MLAGVPSGAISTAAKSSLLNLMVKQGWALRLNVGAYKRAYQAFVAFKKRKSGQLKP